MKNKLSIFLIFLLFLFSNSSSLFAQMNPEEIKKVEDALKLSREYFSLGTTDLITNEGNVPSGGRQSISTAIEEKRSVEENSAKTPSSEFAESITSFVVPEVKASSSFILNSPVEIPLPVDSKDFQSLVSCVPPTPVPSSVIANLKEDLKISDEKDALQEQQKEPLTLESKLLVQIAQKNIARLTGQIEEAKQKLEVVEQGYCGISYLDLVRYNYNLWESFIVILERSRDSWKKVTELVEQGKVEKASLWRKVAEESEISVEGIRQAVQVYISGSTEEAKQLEDEAWSDYYSLRASTMALKKEEALEKADQMQGERRDFWRSCLTSQYEKPANYIQYPCYASCFYEEERLECQHLEVAVESLCYQGDYLVKACEAEKDGKEALSECYKKASFISGKAAVQFSTAAEESKNSGKACRKDVGKSFQAMADYLVKASEAEEIGKVGLAAGYREAAATFERAVEVHGKLSLASYTESHDSLHNEGCSLNAKAECQAKAIEAEEVGKVVLATGYREAAATLERAVEQYQQSALAFASEKNSEGINYEKIGVSLDRQSGYQVMAVEKKEKEKSQENFINKNNMTLDTTGVNDNFNKEGPNRKRMNNLTTMQALFLCCEKWLAETGVTSESNQFLSDYVMDVVQRGANYKLVSAFEEYRNNAIRAHAIGDDSQALGWIQIAEDMQQVIKDSIEYEENDWKNPVKAMQTMIEYRKKYIITPIVSQTPEIMKEWKKIIDESQSVADYHRKYKEASSLREVKKYSLESEQECERFNKAAKYMYWSVNGREKIIRLLSQKSMSTFAQEQPEISIYWRKALEQYQESVGYYSQVANSWLEGNTTNACRFEELASFASDTAHQLEIVVFGLKKAINIRQGNNAEVEALWMETIKLYQKIFEYYPRILNKVMTKDTTDSHYFLSESDSVKNAAGQLDLAFSILEKITNIITINPEKTIALWLQAVKRCHQSYKYYSKLVEAKLDKNEIIYLKCLDAAEAFSKSAKQLDSQADQLNLIEETFKKATTAEAEGKQYAAALWRKKAESYQEEYQRKDAQK
ncbi:MAG TPA: hypothetical protein VJK54_07280 [Chthoniobacterales bacterium]|nr:hypothetical protein [Chthoniobacterales bacterium]